MNRKNVLVAKLVHAGVTPLLARAKETLMSERKTREPTWEEIDALIDICEQLNELLNLVQADPN